MKNLSLPVSKKFFAQGIDKPLVGCYTTHNKPPNRLPTTIVAKRRATGKKKILTKKKKYTCRKGGMAVKEMVFLKNRQALTTSLKVAEVFEKPHNDVLKSIRKLIEDMGGEGKISQTPMFAETTYADTQTKRRRVQADIQRGESINAKLFAAVVYHPKIFTGIKETREMRHAAEVLHGNGGTLYAVEQTTPNGTYHWADSKGGNPPTLKAITRSVVAYTLHGIKHFRQEVIWKHGQRYIKGARKIARQRQAEQKKYAYRREESAKKNYTRIVA